MERLVEAWEYESEPAPFGSGERCAACDADRLNCRMRYRVIPSDVPLSNDLPLDWLLLTCGRCGYEWTEYTASAVLTPAHHVVASSSGE